MPPPPHDGQCIQNSEEANPPGPLGLVNRETEQNDEHMEDVGVAANDSIRGLKGLGFCSLHSRWAVECRFLCFQVGVVPLALLRRSRKHLRSARPDCSVS